MWARFCCSMITVLSAFLWETWGMWEKLQKSMFRVLCYMSDATMEASATEKWSLTGLKKNQKNKLQLSNQLVSSSQKKQHLDQGYVLHSTSRCVLPEASWREKRVWGALCIMQHLLRLLLWAWPQVMVVLKLPSVPVRNLGVGRFCVPICFSCLGCLFIFLLMSRIGEQDVLFLWGRARRRGRTVAGLSKNIWSV